MYRLMLSGMIFYFCVGVRVPIARGSVNHNLADRSPEEIIKNYMFVGDFTTKPEMRRNAREAFWRYPLTIPPARFEVSIISPDNQAELVEEFPATPGSGLAIHHLNRGRFFFLKQDWEKACATWLAARSRFGNQFQYHRRNDYFIANCFLYRASQLGRQDVASRSAADERVFYVNANTFFSWAMNAKKDFYDPLLDDTAPRSFYNQAAIYYKYQKWSGAYGAAQSGLNFLRKTGRNEFQGPLRRILAELYIKNRSYLEAIQQFDLALRTDPQVENGADIFARAADIYFDLNNFELAEDLYHLAIRLDKSLNRFRPELYILRGESLFWMGRFSESQKMMNYGLRSMAYADDERHLPISDDLQALAHLRVADAWLALGRYEDAKLAYFRHEQEFRSHETHNYAQLRLACLELPSYRGNNIMHARKILSSLKEAGSAMPPAAQELAWTCEMASYAQHDRTPAMLKRAKSFAEQYPKSPLIKNLIPAVRDVQDDKLMQLFDEGKIYESISFYEKTKDFLYKNISQELKKNLFRAYVLSNQSEKARAFYQSKPLANLNPNDLILHATMLVEVADDQSQPWNLRSKKIAEHLKNRSIVIEPNEREKLLASRILSQENNKAHLEWLLPIFQSWSKKDLSSACDFVYPAYDQLLSINSKKQKKIKQASLDSFKDYMIANLRDLFRFQTVCALGYMELERQLYRDSSEDLAQIYLERDFMPINEETASFFHDLAEENLKNGRAKLAERLWQVILEKGNQSLPEYMFAQNRIDKSKTQLENLWE